MAPFISDRSTLFEIQQAAGAQGQVVYSVINCRWTDSLCVTVSECRNDNTSMTHTAHTLRACRLAQPHSLHSGRARGGKVSQADFIKARVQGMQHLFNNEFSNPRVAIPVLLIYYRNEDVTDCYTLLLHSSLTLRNKDFTLLQFHNCPNMKPLSFVIDIESTVPVDCRTSSRLLAGWDRFRCSGISVIRHNQTLFTCGYLLNPGP